MHEVAESSGRQRIQEVAASSGRQRVQAGALTALAAALLVGLLFVWGAATRGVPGDPMRYIGLLPGLALFGLGLDWWQARAPRQGLAYLQRATFYWAAAF